MRIVQVMASGGDGGLEKHFTDLCNGLAERGHEVFAVCLAKYANQLSDKVSHIPLDLTGSRYNPITRLRLLQKLIALKPDIVHAQANKAGQLLAPLISRINVKSLVTIHNIKSNLGFTRNFDLTISVSKGVQEKLPNTAKGIVIYNGLQPSIPKETNVNLPNDLHKDQPILLSVGRLVPAKGFDLLIEASRDLPCNILIAGDGPEKPKLNSMLNSLNGKKNIWLLGHRNDITNLMSHADAVVIPSRKEGFSYVFLEALLNRTPVVSTDVPIPNELLPSEFIADISAQSIRELILRALKHIDLNGDFQNLFDYAKQQLTFSEQLNKTLKAYQSIMR